MAKTRISGITIQINGDTTDLEKSLKSVNQEIKDTQNALRDVEKLLKLDPKNTELLAQKQQLLSKAVTDTTSKLEQLNKAQEQMKAEGVDQNSKAYQGLTREIASTEIELNKLKSAAQATNEEIKKTSSVTEDLTAATKKFANGAATVADKTKMISTAAAGALASLVALGINAGKDADELNTIAKQTGLSTDTLQRMKYAADLIDVDFETITASVKKLKKSISSNEKAFDAIGVSVRDANGEYRDTEAIFNDTVTALSKIGNETERDIQSMEIFGKSADELAGIIDDGGQALREIGDEFADKGLIISQAELDRANELNDTLDRIKATVSGDLGKVALELLTTLQPHIEKAAEWLGKVADYIASLDPRIVEISLQILAVIAAISPVAAIISGISAAVGVLIPLVTTLNAAVEANPVVFAITLIIAAVISLAQSIYVVIHHWDEIIAVVLKVYNFLKGIHDKIKYFFVNIVKTAITWGRDLMENLTKGIKEKMHVVTDAVSNVAQKIKDFLGFSEPDKGPLSNFHTFMPDMLELMKKGIDTNLDILNQPLDALASKVAGATQVNVNYNNADLNGRLDTINDSINANGGTVVKVEMAPSIQNLFRAIKTEEYKQSKAMGGA